MGIFDFLFDSERDQESSLKVDEKKKGVKKVASVEDKTLAKDISKTGKTTTDVTQTQIETGKQDTTQAGTQVGTEETARESVTTTLDAGTQNILRDLISGLSGGIAGGGGIVDTKVLDASSGNIDFAQFLQGRAGETEDVLNAQTGDIISEARRQGENALELQGTRLAAGAGSNLNSIVQASQAQGRSDLETQLAGLTANLGIQARQAGSADLLGAFGSGNEAARAGADIQIAGQSGGIQNLSALINNLTGATTGVAGTTTGATTGATTEVLSGLTEGTLEGATSGVGTTEEETQITELIKAIQAIAVESEEERTTVKDASQSGSSSSSPFDNLISLLSIPSRP